MECKDRGDTDCQMPDSRVQEILEAGRKEVFLRAGHVCAIFLVAEWLAGIAVALWVCLPGKYASDAAAYLPVWAAFVWGGALGGIAVVLAGTCAGWTWSRHAMALSQILMSALFIYVSQGKVDSQLLLFVSLPLLALYRDWRVLVSATLAAALTCVGLLAIHCSAAGLLAVHFTYAGFAVGSHWTWLELTAGLCLEDIFLIIVLRQSLNEMRAAAIRQARNEHLQSLVAEAESRLTEYCDINARRASEAALQLAAIVQSTDDAIVGKSLSGTITSWNKGAEKLYGYSAAEVIGKNISILVPAKRTGELKRTAGKLLIGERIETYESVRRCKDGQLVQVSLTESTVYDADGNMSGMSSIARDITQRKKSEQREQLQHRVTRILADAKTLTAATRDILSCLCAYTGWEVAEIWHVDRELAVLRRLDSHDAKAGVFRAFAAAGEKLSLRQGEGLLGIVWQSRSPIWLPDIREDNDFPRRDVARLCGLVSAVACPMIVGSEVMGVLGFFSRGERKLDDGLEEIVESIGKQVAQFIECKLSEELRCEGEARTRAIVENAADGIITFDESGIIQSVNGAAWRIFDCPEQELAGDNVGSRIHLLGDGKILCDAVSGIKADRQLLNQHQEGVGVRKDGSKFPVDFVCSEITLNESKIYTAIVRDITERKEVERHVSEFYSIVSHELRSPLTSILGAMGLMEGGMVGEIPAEAVELISIAKSNCERLIRLVNDILDIRKIEAGKLELRWQVVRAQELVDATVDGLKGMAELAGVKLLSDKTCDYLVNCDRDRMIQVLTNLVSNAIKFSPSGRQIKMIVEAMTSDRLRFCIIDEGPGIREDQLKRLFGKFQQLDSSDSRQMGGTGLGLAICKAIVRQHGGEIGVDTQVGLGSTFWFDLPWKDSYAGEEPLSNPPSPPELTVLLVDDDTQTAKVFLRLLESRGYRTFWVASVAEAEAWLSQELPDVILLEVGLPDGNGLDFLKELSLRPRFQDIPAVIVTGREREVDACGLPAVIDWLDKPADEERILQALNRACQRHPVQYVLVVDDDPSVRTVIAAQLQSLHVKCVQACDGAEAINKVRSFNPDLIVLDVGVPRPDGFEVVDILKSGKHATVPLIVYTGQDLSGKERASLRLGVTRHLTKSRTTSDQLLAAVKELLSTTKGKDTFPLLGKGVELQRAEPLEPSPAAPRRLTEPVEK